MKPRERCETAAQDLFRSRLDQIIDMGEDKLRALLQDSLAVATVTQAMKPKGPSARGGRHDRAAQGGDVPRRR
jgi:hypothetical protein